MTRIRAQKPIQTDEPAKVPDDLGINHDAAPEAPQHVGSFGVNLTYRNQALSHNSRYKGARQYYIGNIKLAFVLIEETNWRVYYANLECPCRCRDFKKERDLHAFLTDQLMARQ